MTPPPPPFQDLTVISCPRCNANYASTQPICPRCRGMGGGKSGRAEEAKNGVREAKEPPIFEATEDPESDLQEAVEDWLKEQHYYFFHDRSKKANVPGFPDLIVALPRGNVIFLELKNKTGRLTACQKKVMLHLSSLGHRYLVIRSLEQFKATILDIINE